MDIEPSTHLFKLQRIYRRSTGNLSLNLTSKLGDLAAVSSCAAFYRSSPASILGRGVLVKAIYSTTEISNQVWVTIEKDKDPKVR